MYKVLFLLPLMGCLSETATGLTAFNLSRDSDEVEEPVDSERRSLMLEARDGSGGFRIRVRDLTGGNGHKDYWQSDLSCASQGVASEETTGGLTEYWLDCTHNDFDGRVSLAANFTPQTDDENHVEVWLDNQLVGASITNAMYLMRINGASYPEKGEDLKARFLVEEWISNPMVQMRESGEMTTRAGHLPICDNATPRNCVWKNRNKGTPAMSLHTPDWGMLLHTMDPDNADSGYLVLGGAVNEELESRLDFGYEAQLSNTDVEANGGGLIRISPVLSARTLPAELPLNDAWWEALEVYRDYVENETNLLPEVPLTQSPTFAPWSETCVYNALYVLDEHGNVKVDDIAQFFDEMMAFYAEPGDPVDICPLLWAALSDAPYAFKPGTQELIDALHTAADRYPNVEVHPVFYVNTACADPSFDVPASAWTLYNNKHWICHDGTSWTIDPSVKEVSDALRAILPVAFEMGFEGVYHDAPFGDYIVPDTGGDRRFGVAFRNIMEILAQAVADNGGGVVVTEDGRLGLHAQQTRMANLSYPYFVNSSTAAFGPALNHGHHLTGTTGSIGDGVWPYILADAIADDFVKPTCVDRPRGGSVLFEKGRVNNSEHIPRHAIYGAVLGGVVHDSQAAHWRTKSSDPAVYAAWKKRYVEILRDISGLRNRTPALRHGRMVTPPSTDIQRTVVAFRTPVKLPGNTFETYSCQLGVRDVPEVEMALYEDPENTTDLVLVLGNAMKDSRTVTVDISTLRHPRLGPLSDLTAVDSETGEVLVAADAGLPVDVPGYTLRVLHLSTQ